MNPSKLNLVACVIIAVFMAFCFVFTGRTAKEIVIVGLGMLVCQSGVPTAILIDKIIEGIKIYKGVSNG